MIDYPEHGFAQLDLPVATAWAGAPVAGRIAAWRGGQPDSPHRLLLLHGVGITAATWRGVVPFLVPQAQVVVIDLLGFGRSIRERGSLATMPAQSAMIPQLLDHLGWPSAVLVGHSMGGGAALGAALLVPQRVDGLVLIASVGAPQPVPWWFQALYLPGAAEFLNAVVRLGTGLGRQEAIGRWFNLDPVAAADSVECISQLRVAKSLEQAMRDLRPARYTERFAQFSQIQQPALLLHGQLDDIVPPSVPERLLATLPHGELVWFERAAHMPHERYPREVALAVLGWLEKLPAARA